jgi:hypothetical protein
VLRPAPLLLLLAAAHVHAQSVQIDACNAGDTAFDLILSQSGRIKITHIGPADCAQLAESRGAMAQAQFGFAFADEQGKWSTARRLDVLPGWKGLARISQNTTVAHNNAQVPATLQLQLTPAVPVCHTEVTQAPSNVSQLPLGASPAQLARARSLDVGNSGDGSVNTYCDNIGYTLNIVAYADSHEISFATLCAACDKKAQAAMTPAEREAAQRRADVANGAIGMMAAAGPLGAIFGNLVGQARDENARQLRLDRYRFGAPQRIAWTDLPRYAREAYGDPGIENKYVAVQGTIERVNLPDPGAETPLVDVYFKEGSDKSFNFCTTVPEVFRDAFGANYASSMIGKSVEVQGEVTRNTCQSGAGIRVTLMHQIKLVGTGPSMVAAAAPAPYKFPAPKSSAPIHRVNFDPGRPNYDPDTESLVSFFCNGMYNPSAVSLPPNLNQLKFEQRDAIKKEVEQCNAHFDPAELNMHRKLAMRYCFGHNDYLKPSKTPNLRQLYDDCMLANDPLTAMCKRELDFRVQLVQNPKAVNQICPAPAPSTVEVYVLRQGGEPEFARGFIPDTPPGIPADLLTSLEPGLIQKNAPPPLPATPAPQPAKPDPAAAPNPVTTATQQQAETRARNARRVACRQQAVKDYPRGGQDALDALRACNQMD